ncbi:ABC transporter permease [Paenibacillus caui]|uniref:ABC transporter permease n=1 Tax=Paenibacillus caui TaxID=2873927 RepID=UPI001CA876A2|nr:ABC transporter permease [Paenibacillus caui]
MLNHGSGFGKLVVNEWLKLSKKRSFFIAFLIMAGFVALLAYLTTIAPSGETYTALRFAAECMEIRGLGSIMLYIVIISTSGIVAREHSMGTIKFLMIRAHGRSRILASKYVVALLYMLALAVFTLAVTLAAGWVVFGFGASEVSWADLFLQALYTLVYMFVYTTFVFMIGVLTRSAGATIGIGMFAVVLQSILNMVLSRYAFAKYLLFTNTDLSVYATNTAPIKGMTLTFSVIILSVYVILFLAASFVTFKRRDIA